MAGANLRRLLGVAERDTTDREVLIFDPLSGDPTSEHVARRSPSAQRS